MVSRGDHIVVLWPQYYDAGLSRNEGRKVAKKYAMSGIKLEHLLEAARDLKLQVVVERRARYPGTPWKECGRLLVRKTGKKGKILKMVGARLNYIYKKEGKGGDGREGGGEKKDEKGAKVKKKGKKSGKSRAKGRSKPDKVKAIGKKASGKGKNGAKKKGKKGSKMVRKKGKNETG